MNNLWKKTKVVLSYNDEVLIKIYLLDGSIKLMTEFPRENWKMHGIDNTLKMLHETGLTEQ